jgi:hypothetical protein
MGEFVELKLKLICVAGMTCMTKSYPRVDKSHRLVYQNAKRDLESNLELRRVLRNE